MITSQVILCKQCSGTGISEKKEIADYHRVEYDNWTETCTMCEGNGRLLETTSVSYEPYATEELINRLK